MTIFLIAFLGGVILNFMPCVLPVLMIKLLDISRAVDQDRKSVRLGFLSSAVGIITSFFALAVFAILLKNFGFFVTWGMQFQQPVFITMSCILILAFSASLLGWFKFRHQISLSIAYQDQYLSDIIRQFGQKCPATFLPECSLQYLQHHAQHH